MKINLNKYIYLITYKGKIYKLMEFTEGTVWNDITGNEHLGVYKPAVEWARENKIKITPIPIGGLDGLASYINNVIDHK